MYSPHDVNTTVVTCVKFQHHLSHVLHAVDTSCQGENCTCFAGAGGPVEEKMWESLSYRELLNNGL